MDNSKENKDNSENAETEDTGTEPSGTDSGLKDDTAEDVTDSAESEVSDEDDTAESDTETDEIGGDGDENSVTGDEEASEPAADSDAGDDEAGDAEAEDLDETDGASAEAEAEAAETDDAESAEDDADPGEETGEETGDAPAESQETLESALATSPLIASGADESRHAGSEETAPATPEPNHSDHYEEHDEEEHGRSFAARVLTWLILLIAGGGLALWGGPKVAPHLPSGLGPVKAWLMPGTLETEGRITALEEDLGSRIDAIEPGASSSDVTSAVSAGVSELETRLRAEMQALIDKVEAADSASVEGRLAQLESRLEGVAAEIASLSGLTEGVGDAAAADLGAFSATVEGLRAEIGSLADQQGALSQRIDDVEVAVNRKLEEAEAEIAAVTEEAEATKSVALARAALTAIEAALSAGEPFEQSLQQLEANTDEPVPGQLGSVAGTGVATLGKLRDGFPDAAHAAIRAAVRESGKESVGGRLAAFIESQVATRSLTPQEGPSTDAVLSRAEDALRRDNLALAVEELTGLPEAASAAMQDWILRARDRVEAQAALQELRAALAPAN